jgi:hypothetical protein
MKVIAIDPGATKSGYVIWDGSTIAEHAITSNYGICVMLSRLSDCSHEGFYMAIEKVACYGMPVGESTFETVFWTGRFCQAWAGPYERIKRLDAKMHLCHDSRAKDSNIRQALIDRFGSDKMEDAILLDQGGQPVLKKSGKNKGDPKMVKQHTLLSPLVGHEWAAFAIAVYWMDVRSKICEGESARWPCCTTPSEYLCRGNDE